MSAIYLADLLRPEYLLLPFLCVPILVAAGFTTVRHTVMLSVAMVIMVFADGWLNHVGGQQPDFDVDSSNWWLLTVALVISAGVAIFLAASRANSRERGLSVERSLDEAEMRYRLLAENASDVVYVLDTQGKVTWMSASVEGALGWTPDELVGQLMSELMHPEDRSATAPVRKALHEGDSRDQTMSFLVRIRNKDGDYVWGYGTARSLFDDAGTPIGAIVGARVVDDLVRAREALQRDRDKLRATFDSMLDSHITLTAIRDADAGVIDLEVADVNAAASAYFGVRREELVGMRVKQLHPKFAESSLYPLLSRVIETGEPLIEHGLLLDIGPAPTNATRHFDVRAAKFGDGLSVNFRDVTEEFRAAAEVAESRERYRWLAENSSDVVYRTDADGVIQWVSPSVEEVLGVEPESVLGQRSFDLMHPDDAQFMRELHLEYRDEPLTQAMTMDRPIRFVTHNGHHRWMTARIRLLVEGDSDLSGAVVGLRDVTKEHVAHLELAHQAFHDPLTGLRNRAWILDSLESDLRIAERAGNGVAVYFVDLDNFKLINDSLGHAAGDEVLTLIAHRLTDALRPGDRVGRFGGDEFIVVIPDVPDVVEAELIADRISREVGSPLEVQGHTIVPSASIGVAISNRSSTAGGLLRDADAALFRAKSDGRARWRFFDEQMHVEAVNRLTLEGEIREGLRNEEFRVFYQPIVSLQDGSIHGFEALVRWAHPTRGLLGPADFLTAAEESGLIADIGTDVLRRVCRLIAENQQLTGQISINVSAVQLSRPHWTSTFLYVLSEFGVDPHRLVIEVTETAVLALPPGTVSDLKALRELGVGIHVDDFGTGFSSISLLRDLPVTGMKLDSSFVRNLTEHASTSNALAAGLIGLAAGLHLTSIAEGIETPHQAGMLAAQGWQFGQGYLFGRPEPMPTRQVPETSIEVDPAPSSPATTGGRLN